MTFNVSAQRTLKDFLFSSNTGKSQMLHNNSGSEELSNIIAHI